MESIQLHRIFSDFDEKKAKEALLLMGEAVSKHGKLNRQEFEEILDILDDQIKGERRKP